MDEEILLEKSKKPAKQLKGLPPAESHSDLDELDSQSRVLGAGQGNDAARVGLSIAARQSKVLINALVNDDLSMGGGNGDEQSEMSSQVLIRDKEESRRRKPVIINLNEEGVEG